MHSLKLLGALALLISTPQTFAVKSHDFKTCSQAGFCRRGRALASRAKEASSWTSPYSIDLSTIEIAHDSAKFTAQVKSSLYPDAKFGLDVRLHTDGVVRVRMDEINGLKKRYDEAASWALISEPEVSKSMKWSVGKTEFKAKFGEGQEFEVVVQFNPLKIVLLKGSKEQIVLNGQGLLHMEHFRSKKVEAEGEQKPEGSEGAEDAQTVMKVKPNAWFEGEDEDAYWEETFGSWTDSKPKGRPPTACKTITDALDQVLSLCLSIYHSPTMQISMAYRNMRHAYPFPPPPATHLISRTLIDSTTQTFSNILHHRQCPSTALSLSSMPILLIQLSAYSTPLGRRHGLTYPMCPINLQRPTGSLNPEFSTYSSCQDLLPPTFSPSIPNSPEHPSYLRTGHWGTTSAGGTILALMTFALFKSALTKRACR